MASIETRPLSSPSPIEREVVGKCSRRIRIFTRLNMRIHPFAAAPAARRHAGRGAHRLWRDLCGLTHSREQACRWRVAPAG
jgi:hypothetical protein